MRRHLVLSGDEFVFVVMMFKASFVCVFSIDCKFMRCGKYGE